MSNFHDDEIIFISDEEEFMSASQATMPPSSQPLASDMDDVLEITDGEDEEALDSHRPSSSRASEGRYSPLPPSSPPTEAAYLSDSDIEIDDTAALNLYATRAPLMRTNSAASSSRILNLLDATSLSDEEEEFPLAASLSQPRSSPSKRSRNEANIDSDDDASTGSPPKKARASAVRCRSSFELIPRKFTRITISLLPFQENQLGGPGRPARRKRCCRCVSI